MRLKAFAQYSTNGEGINHFTTEKNSLQGGNRISSQPELLTIFPLTGCHLNENTSNCITLPITQTQTGTYSTVQDVPSGMFRNHLLHSVLRIGFAFPAHNGGRVQKAVLPNRICAIVI